MILLGGLMLPGMAETVYTLPLDLSAGQKLDKGNYNGKEHYKDPTIQMDVTENHYGETIYWMAEVRVQHASQLRTMPAYSFERSATAEGTKLSRRANAVLSCNGDYWWRDVQWKGNYVLRQGVLYMHSFTGETDVLLIDEDGDFQIVHQSRGEVPPLPETEGGPVYYQGKQIYNGFCFGPALIEDGKAVPVEPNEKIVTDKKMARMALCQLGPLHYAIVCSYKGSMTLGEFTDMLATLPIQTAYNLDGGNSAMLMTGQSKLNYNPTTRELSDIIYFASAWPGK